ncbi:MAG: lytic transglycosylase domain-containing protein [Amphritea sp.]|uniref:lytic transglycosylase domain-containing protein n=1 Tax=Amphritea sp. TaxID=1872502 RepID=UPI001B631B3F|nr:lytic transglycosylase domain-containing protein [Amphritea sp.]MBQ0757321.1 lytic transglycosylase domain-containing protein [Amphritea sp.]MBQ0784834.1 lytic transglycosylase domain-containing protein [Amphritea sp.]
MRLTLSLLILLFSLPLFAASQEIDPELREALKQAFAESSSFEDRFAAEVWLTDMSGRTQRYVSNDLERIEILRTVHAEADRVELPVSLVLGLIHTESLFNRFAVSVVGAQGLMQIMPFWKKEIGRSNDNLTNIQTNIRYGSTILKHYIKRSKGNLTEALARYNGSYGKVWYPEKVYRNQKRYQN